jgi:hypothetical protein
MDTLPPTKWNNEFAKLLKPIVAKDDGWLFELRLSASAYADIKGEAHGSAERNFRVLWIQILAVRHRPGPECPFDKL